MREQIKKQIFEALESGTQIENPKYTSDQLSIDIESSVYELTGKNSKDKAYREKTKKVINRLKGNRNQVVRNILKNGTISVSEFTKLSDKEIDDDNYFNKYSGEDVSNIKGSKGITKPPKIPVISVNVDLSKSKRVINLGTTNEINDYFANNNEDAKEETTKTPENSRVEDKTEIVQDVIEQVEQPVLTIADEDRNLIQLADVDEPTEKVEHIERTQVIETTKSIHLNNDEVDYNITTKTIVTHNKITDEISTTNNEDDSTFSVKEDIKTVKVVHTETHTNHNTIFTNPQDNLQALKELVKKKKNQGSQRTFNISLDKTNQNKNEIFNSEVDKVMASNEVSKGDKEIFGENLDTLQGKQNPFDDDSTFKKINIKQNPVREGYVSNFDSFKTPMRGESNPLDISMNKSVYSTRDNYDKLKGEVKVLRESKVNLETNLEIAVKKGDVYEKEIKLLRDTISEMRLNFSKINEEAMKIEISRLNSVINNKDKEIQILTKDNGNMKDSLNRYQNNIETMLEENKRFRQETEKKFNEYRELIDSLRANRRDNVGHRSVETNTSNYNINENTNQLTYQEDYMEKDYINNQSHDKERSRQDSEEEEHNIQENNIYQQEEDNKESDLMQNNMLMVNQEEHNPEPFENNMYISKDFTVGKNDKKQEAAEDLVSNPFTNNDDNVDAVFTHINTITTMPKLQDKPKINLFESIYY
jgi:hypothetical protein